VADRKVYLVIYIFLCVSYTYILCMSISESSILVRVGLIGTLWENLEKFS
jgi:hypothetical protein